MVELDFAKAGGLVTAIAVDYETNDILMVAYINEESWKLTLETGKVHYWSRSRNKLWKKGESSGNMQEVKEIFVDCDSDAVVIKVVQTGSACHEGYRSCFYRKVDENGDLQIVLPRLMNPEDMYGKK